MRGNRVTRGAATFVVGVTVMASAGSDTCGQTVSAWADATAAHSRPPAGIGLAAASYGLLGLRLQFDGAANSGALSMGGGRGVEASDGGWLNGRAAWTLSRTAGMLDGGVTLEASGLHYLQPVRFGSGTEFTQQLGVGTVRPWAGLSVLGARVGLEAVVTRGAWSSETTTSGTPLPVPPLPPRQVTREDGTIALTGGTLSLLGRVSGLMLQLTGHVHDAENSALSGRYVGASATATLSAGSVDLNAGLRTQRDPADSLEIGFHAGAGFGVGEGFYLQGAAGRSVADPLYGGAGGTWFSVALAQRIGHRRLGPPVPADVGEVRAGGRTVRFTLQHTAAQSVAVAGDFSGWETRPLQRGANGMWTLETVIPPGIYHYAFVVDGSEWTVPSGAKGLVDDGFGRKNATLVVTERNQR